MTEPRRVVGQVVRPTARPVGDPVRTRWDEVDETAAPAVLDDLADVDAPITAVGVLARTVPGQPAEFRPVSYRHEQPVDLPAEQWLIAHDLPFVPSGIRVTGEDGQTVYPRRVVHPAVGRTRLEFAEPRAGTAELS